MPNKLQNIEELAINKLEEFSKQKKEWTNFLNSASYNYKYSFKNQIMIYIQRPDATACAEMKTWNTRLHRWLKKNSKRNCNNKQFKTNLCF